MFADTNRDEADRQAAQFATSLEHLIPWLKQYVHSRLGHSIARCHDVEDIIQMTLLQVLVTPRNASGPIHNLRAYLRQVASSCISDHFQRKARQPAPVENLELLVDHTFPLPDRAAQDREARAPLQQGSLRLHEWRPRFLTTLVTFNGQLGELDEIRQTLSPLIGFDVHPRSRTQGRPTTIEHVGNLLGELRPKVAVLTEFFQEP